jgi:ubiquinone biosynthesis protein
VPANHSVAAFAQALRAVGEQVFGRAAAEIPMSRVLTQLFEITALYEMRLRPELVLLQKTMASVEGVARRIDPDHDIWEAARPVVERWIARELSPAARAKRVIEQGVKAVEGLAAWAETAGAPVAPVVVSVRPNRAGPIALVIALLALAAAGAALWVSVAPG